MLLRALLAPRSCLSQSLSAPEAAPLKLSTAEQCSMDSQVGPLGPSAVRQFQIASSLRPDLQGSFQRSRVNLLCLLGVCAFLRPKVFASKCQGPAGKVSSPSPSLPLSPSSEAGFCLSCSPPPSLHTCFGEPGGHIGDPAHHGHLG